MKELYGGSINYDKLLTIISDAAPYAIKAVNVMKFLFPNTKHVTCIAHMLHRLCEKLRDISPNTNFICSEIKRILIKNKENQLIFNNITKLKLPKFAIITRWGT
ncbi:hypothetical protein DMUE_0417 [Dictyocoela muelleri]|nr:hypothetical protein DMUE_0417 [Dictyocoela muelleri]